MTAERIEWTSNAAHVTVGKFPVGPLSLDLADGVTIEITGAIWEPQPGTFVVDAGARVTITGRLSEDATLLLKRGAR